MQQMQEMQRMQRIYVAGPYTKGDVAANVRAAIEVANELADLGYAPYVPHLTHFWHMLCPRPYEEWVALGIDWVRACDAVLRLPGESAGADQEVAFAERNGIPVFNSIAAIGRP